MKLHRSHHLQNRRVIAALAGTAAVVGSPVVLLATSAAPAAAASAYAYGYVWANQPTAAHYTPSTEYQVNSTNRENNVTRNATGNYTVNFPGLQHSGGGTVDVTAYDSRGYCKVASWGSIPKRVAVSVLCFSNAGSPQDSYFDAIFAAPATFTPANLSYLWANQPTTPSYTPSTSYQYNSGGGTDTITRNGTGSYTAAIPHVGLESGTVKVTGYGSDNTTCGVTDWFGSPTVDVNVHCTDPAGAPADAYFTLTWVNDASLLVASSGAPKGYVWANEDTTASYTPDSLYAYNDLGGTNTVTRSSTGQYIVDFPQLGGTDGDVQVSSYDSTARCNSAGWGTDGSGGASVYVDCYSPSGALTDSLFTAQYQV